MGQRIRVSRLFAVSSERMLTLAGSPPSICREVSGLQSRLRLKGQVFGLVEHFGYDENDDVYGKPNDPRFSYTPKSFDKIPWKSILLALFLLFLGSLLLFLSYFIFTGHMGGDLSQAYGLLALGILTFLPGFYETRIAYYAWRGAKGYRFASIPDY
ncbi:PREDICTED: transmembrane [Prunus dulcis]|uniref:PREDICTED: transmembrane n=1 Tax=Prunus dulcis TaxID=3755 RepID=A0A5E4EWC8_PRUDU|nr:PREDICTED: transmembrane [Prunus dulcis]